jgi:Fe-S-cluster containining protein
MFKKKWEVSVPQEMYIDDFPFDPRIICNSDGMANMHEYIYERMEKQKTSDILAKAKGRLGQLVKSNRRFDDQFCGDSACPSGCYGCCYHMFAISEYDFMLILYLLSKDKERLNYYVELAKLQYEMHVRLNRRIISLMDSGDFEYGMDLATARKLPCLFLSARGKCEIYEARPYQCRAYGSTYPCATIENGHKDDNEFFDEHCGNTGKDITGLSGKKNRADYPIFYWFSEFLSENNYDKTLAQMKKYLKK